MNNEKKRIEEKRKEGCSYTSSERRQEEKMIKDDKRRKGFSYTCDETS